jgi:hypothetical protein
LSKLLTVPDLAVRWHCHIDTAREAVLRSGFPKPIMPTGSARLRLWREDEVAKWEATEGRRAA